jgi:hypothetical protein
MLMMSDSNANAVSVRPAPGPETVTAPSSPVLKDTALVAPQTLANG